MELKLSGNRVVVDGVASTFATINDAVRQFARERLVHFGPVVEVIDSKSHFLVVNHESGQVLFDSASEATGRSVK